MGDIYDVTIIGGGPAGMYAAFYCGMRDMKTKVIEAKGQLGGFMHMYPEKTIWDVGGIPPISCKQLMEWMSGQAATFQPTIVFNQQITSLIRHPAGHIVLESNGNERHETKSVILAIGRGVTRINKLQVVGADHYNMTNLYYTIQDLESFRNKNVLVSGGGNTAVDWAAELLEVAGSVTLVHRRDEFQAMEWRLSQLRQGAQVRTPYVIDRLHGSSDEIYKVDIRHVDTNKCEEIEVDAVVVNHGYERDYAAIQEWGIALKDGEIIVDGRGATNVEGVFAAGDCVTHERKVYLIASAISDAIQAANGAKLFSAPAAKPVAIVSSHSERFKSLNQLRRGERETVSRTFQSVEEE